VVFSSIEESIIHSIGIVFKTKVFLRSNPLFATELALLAKFFADALSASRSLAGLSLRPLSASDDAGAFSSNQRHSVLVTFDNDRGLSGSRPFASASNAANNCAGIM
jgi:hypothetical protein